MTESESRSRLVTIQVTEEDISEGIRGDRFRCPIAIAINRHLRDAVASVDVFSIAFWASEEQYIVNPGEVLTRKTPRLVHDFVHNFDDYGPEKAQPFSFELELPEWVVKTENQEQDPE